MTVSELSKALRGVDPNTEVSLMCGSEPFGIFEGEATRVRKSGQRLTLASDPFYGLKIVFVRVNGARLAPGRRAVLTLIKVLEPLGTFDSGSRDLAFAFCEEAAKNAMHRLSSIPGIRTACYHTPES